MILSSGYRQSIGYSNELIIKFQKEWEKIERVFVSLYRKLELASAFNLGNVLEEKLTNFYQSISNDFNFANGITSIYEINKEINKELRANSDLTTLDSLYQTLSKMLDVLGLVVDIKPLSDSEKELVNKWNQARAEKNFELADTLRQQINELGIKL